ncbi:hypothetical protein ACS0TY_004518 [Phlomoides rotata]
MQSTVHIPDFLSMGRKMEEWGIAMCSLAQDDHCTKTYNIYSLQFKLWDKSVQGAMIKLSHVQLYESNLESR